MYLQEVSQNLHTTHHLLLLPEILRHPLQRPDDATQQHVGETGSDGKFDCVHGTVADGGEEKSKTHSRQALGGKYVRVRQLTVVGKYFIRGTGTYPGTK